MAVNSTWLPGTPEVDASETTGGSEQDIEQRPASPAAAPPLSEKRQTRAPAPPLSGPLPLFQNRLNGDKRSVQSTRKQNSRGNGNLLREASSQSLPAPPPPQEPASQCSSEDLQEFLSRHSRHSVEEPPQAIASLVNEEVKEELRLINRKLDDMARQLKGKKCSRSSTDPLENGAARRLSANPLQFERGGREGGGVASNSLRRDSTSSLGGGGSRRSSLAEVRVDTPAIKTLYKQRSMKFGAMSNGLEMVLSTTPPPPSHKNSAGDLPQTPSRFQTLMSWGRSRTTAFDAAAENKYGNGNSLKQTLERGCSQESSAASGDLDFPRATSARSLEGTAEDVRNSKISKEGEGNQSKWRHDLADDDVARAAAMLANKCGFSLRRSIWNFIENPESSTMARWFEKFNACFIICTALVTVMQAVEGSPVRGVPAAVIETAIDVIFLCELVVRFVCCPSTWVWLFSIYNWIDVLAAAPFVVRASIGWVLPEGEVQSVPHAILICAVPTLRLLKTLRRFEKFHLLIKAFHLAAEALPVLLFILIVIAMVFSALIYLVEPRDNIPSLPRAFWLSIVTMTTVGYGDVTPKTGAGNCIIGVLVVITVLYMAVPLGIIGNAFTDTWQDRDRILLMQRTRDRLCQWGYTAHDIPALFRITDSNADGELDIKEFRKLLNQMQVGLGEERIIKLFKSFDGDGSGTVDDQEFVRALFPEAYHAIYADSDSDDEEDVG